MTSVAIFKWAMNPHDERVGSDGEIKWLAERPEVGDDDHEAVKVALDATPDGTVMGLTFDSGDTAFGVARGTAGTVAIESIPVTAQPTQIAKALAEAIKGMQDVELVAIGDSAWQPMVPSLLAGMLGWPCVLAVDAARVEDGALVVTRRFGAGTQDLRIDGPVVLGVAARREEESKPGMRAVLQARKKPVEKVAASYEDAAVFAVAGSHEPQELASKLFDGTDPQGAAAQLVGALRSEGVL